MTCDVIAHTNGRSKLPTAHTASSLRATTTTLTDTFPHPTCNRPSTAHRRKNQLISSIHLDRAVDRTSTCRHTWEKRCKQLNQKKQMRGTNKNVFSRLCDVQTSHRSRFAALQLRRSFFAIHVRVWQQQPLHLTRRQPTRSNSSAAKWRVSSQ